MSPFPRARTSEERYVGWFHELDAWTEYWDIYHPETCGRFYFGDGQKEHGLLTRFLPRAGRPPAFAAWSRMALTGAAPCIFWQEVKAPEVASAIMEVDALVGRLFSKHFGDAEDPAVRADYLEAIFRFATDALPPAVERDRRIAASDLRKATAGRHTLDGDLMWFCWALHIEGANAIAGTDAGHARRALLLAGIATGCAANFAWRGHRRTRAEYHRDAQTAAVLRQRGSRWALDFGSCVTEVHTLYRIREWGAAQ